MFAQTPLGSFHSERLIQREQPWPSEKLMRYRSAEVQPGLPAQAMVQTR